MIVKETTNAAIIPYLADKLIINEGFDLTQSCHSLIDRMIATPDEVFVCVAVDENEIEALLIAYIVNGSDFVWVWQAWASQKVSKAEKADMFNRLKRWTTERGLNKLRCETHRSDRLKAFLRTWGFEKISEVLECQIKIQM